MNPPAEGAGRDEADRAADMLTLIDALEPLLEQETALVRAGRLADAAALQTRKSELAAGYMAAYRQLKSDAGRLSPRGRAEFAAARERHERLRAVLQMNMTVVATAHAVAEGLIRGAAAEVTRSNAPQTYGASGRYAEPPVRRAPPVAVNQNF